MVDLALVVVVGFRPMMTFRDADIGDAYRLLEWRNDALTREMSRSPEPIGLADHLIWFTSRLMRNPTHLYIAEFDREPVGTFRIDGEEISYTIAPDCRGKRLSIEMLIIAHKAFGPLKAEIYPRNIASIRAASAAGHKVVLLELESIAGQAIDYASVAPARG